ncbi:ACT domain-containing protein [Corynebacterium pacaense]|uniref:ACT domain-containing protein n=1 Tax=Corynebacterium pacaense TaxID=1816684 RepID=UPI0009BC62BC|nr:ACT domain-containing protein [Corynebacterium pacaense]
MFAIMTVTGKDHTGIIAAVSTALANVGVNIHNVSQTIMDEWFTMILHVGFNEDELDIATIQNEMVPVERDQDLVIRIQSEALFSAVNEI